MSQLIHESIATVKSGKDLPAEAMQDAINEMLQGKADQEAIAALLLALREKGEAVSELIGAARALRANMTPIHSPHKILLDTCGTGGDGSGTFNISTAAAIVVAAAGVPVAKHGNRRMSSLTGSADVLSLLGVRIDATREVVERCLAELSICFCFAPALHPAMRHVSEVRRKLGVRTLFNLVGPLCNPAGATHQLLGTGDRLLQEQLAVALNHLDTVHGAVVRGEDGLDEVTLMASTVALEIQPQGIERIVWTVQDFGMNPVDPAALAVSGPEESAAMIHSILAGNDGPPRDIVITNAAAALWLAGKYSALIDAVAAAAHAIDCGAANQLLHRLSRLSNMT